MEREEVPGKGVHLQWRELACPGGDERFREGVRCSPIGIPLGTVQRAVKTTRSLQVSQGTVSIAESNKSRRPLPSPPPGLEEHPELGSNCIYQAGITAGLRLACRSTWRRKGVTSAPHLASPFLLPRVTLQACVHQLHLAAGGNGSLRPEGAWEM